MLTRRRIALTGWRNCSRCTRWRPIHDYRPRSWLSGGSVERINGECNACHRERSRAQYHGLPFSRKRAKAENSREHHAISRRLRGLKVNGPRKPNQHPGVGGMVPWDRLQHIAELRGYTIEALADSADVSERRFLEYKRTGEIPIASADKVCIALGTHLNLVYPELSYED